MKVSLLLVIMLLIVSLCPAVDYMLETVGGKTFIYMSLPYSLFNFRHSKGKYITESELKISIYDKKHKTKFSETSEVYLHFNNRAEVNRKKYPKLYITDLDDGQYLIIIHIQSVNYEKDIRLHIRNNRGKSLTNSSLYAFCYSGESVYEPDGNVDDADSVVILHYSSEKKAVLSAIETEQEQNYARDSEYLLYKIKLKPDEKNLKQVFRYSLNGKSNDLRYKLDSSAYKFRRSHSGREQIEQLQIIERSNLIRKLNAMKPEDLESALDSYWTQTDRTAGDNVNEYQLAFYNAIKLCNEKFSVLGYKMGWDTDMGRVFLEYGQPDEIIEESYPRAEDYNDLFTGTVLESFYEAVNDFSNIQIWLYYTQNEVFLFIEKYGANNYELQN